jgi:hypothetical protein
LRRYHEVAKGTELPPLRMLPDPNRAGIREMVSVVAVITTAYVCQYCVHPLYAELKAGRCGLTPAESRVESTWNSALEPEL